MFTGLNKTADKKLIRKSILTLAILSLIELYLNTGSNKRFHLASISCITLKLKHRIL